MWGIDPSAEMLQRARARPDARGIGWKQGAAERLPFRDGWFDAGPHAPGRAHARRPQRRALAEIARVLGPDGRLVIATFAAEHFDRFFLNPYFPSLAGIDRARFPEPAALAADVAAAGFAGAHIERISQPVRADADDVLERVRGRYISTLHLLDPDEYAAGLGRLEAEVRAGREAFGLLARVGASHRSPRIARMPSAKAVAPPLAGWRT